MRESYTALANHGAGLSGDRRWLQASGIERPLLAYYSWLFLVVTMRTLTRSNRTLFTALAGES